MKVRRIVVLFLFFFLVSFLSNVPAQVNAQTQVSKMRNIAITMIICSESYDAFADWIKPYSSFHNYTLIINRESDSNYSWFLENKTRVDFLT